MIKTKFFNGKLHLYDVIIAGLLVVMAAFMVLFAGRQSFNLDELAELDIVSGGSILNILKMYENSPWNLPLDYLIRALFYRVMPYGEVYMLLPSIIFVLLGVIALGKAGKEIGGKELGFYAMFAAVFSFVLIKQGAWQMRPYAMLFCAGSLMLYCLARRLRNESGKNIALYTAVLLFFLYCHWFSSIVALSYAAIDLILVLKKKISVKCLLSYIAAGAFFTPWFVLMLIYHQFALRQNWMLVPNVMALVDIFKYLLSGGGFLFAVFVLGVFVAIFKFIQGNYKDGGGDAKNLIVFYMLASIICTLGLVFIYSRFINPKGSCFTSRYFFSILPQVFIFAASGITQITNFTLNINGKSGALHINGLQINKFLLSALCSFILFCSGIQNYEEVHLLTSGQTYREVAEYLSKQEDIKNGDTMVVMTDGLLEKNGNPSIWINYYFKRRGFTVPAAFSCGNDFPLYQYYKNGALMDNPELVSEEELLKFDKLYVFAVSGMFGFAPHFHDFLREHYSEEEIMPGFSVHKRLE